MMNEEEKKEEETIVEDQDQEDELKEEEKTESSEEQDDEADYEELDVSSNNQSSSRERERYQLRLIKLFGLVIVVVILIIVVFYLLSLGKKKSYTYGDVESILKNAAVSYFKDNEKELPTASNSVVEIRDNILISQNYMKAISEYISDDSCTGKVLVKKVSSNNYRYTPYLDCKENYKTQKLYDVILKNGKVDSNGYGLYKLNDEYVYRGKDVNNYVKFKDIDHLWRIVKITKTGEIVLITADKTVNTYLWDSRYNSSDEYTSGINVFDKSYMSEILKVLYNSNKYNKTNDIERDVDGEYKYFTKEERQRLVSYDLCVGKRSSTDTSRDGSSECSVKQKVKVGLLPVYDYLNASLDSGCTSTISKECQNYNYLANSSNFWLANGNSIDTVKVFFVTSRNYVDSKSADNSNFIRPVIHLDKDMALSTGQGTANNPYVIN